VLLLGIYNAWRRSSLGVVVVTVVLLEWIDRAKERATGSA
jgi:hypothetical protein